MKPRTEKKIAQIDIDNLSIIRNNVLEFTKSCASKYDDENKILLDIAPQIHQGAKPFFIKSIVETLDIDASSSATYIADLCNDNSDIIPNNYFDYVLCTEVLEHTLQPFNAANEIFRVLKPEGMVFLTVPFNLRIHGPLPDCWRFTEHGLRAIFDKFKIINLSQIESENRFLMPIHYTMIAQKPL